MPNSLLAAGWYADGSGVIRWWDGGRWCAETIAAPPLDRPTSSEHSAFGLRLALLRPGGDAPVPAGRHKLDRAGDPRAM